MCIASVHEFATQLVHKLFDLFDGTGQVVTKQVWRDGNRV